MISVSGVTSTAEDKFQPQSNNPDSDYIENWDEYWYEGALWASRKSKDPRCRVGALVIRDGVMVASGFNGLARNLFDNPQVLDDAEEKLKWICHAEANAIFNAARQGVILKGATIYVTKFPCLGCCNAILQAGIARIYTHDDKYWGDDPADADHSRKKSLIQQAKLEVVAPFHPDYSPRKRGVRRAPVDVTPREQSTPVLNNSRHLQALQSPKSKARKPEKIGQQSLFPARRSIPGGRA